MRTVGAPALLTSKIHKRHNAEGSHHAGFPTGWRVLIRYRPLRRPPRRCSILPTCRCCGSRRPRIAWALLFRKDKISKPNLPLWTSIGKAATARHQLAQIISQNVLPGKPIGLPITKAGRISTRRKHAKLAKFAVGTVDCPGSLIKRNRILVRIIRGHSLKRMTRFLCNSIMLLCLAAPLAIWEKSC